MNSGNHTTVVFFGDSVTEGCFELFPASCGFDTVRAPEKAYVSKLSSMLAAKYGANRYTLINAGVSGNNAAMGLTRIENDVLSHSPDIVTVAFGLNDVFGSPERYEKNLGLIFKKIYDAGARAILLTPNMMNTYIHPATLPEAVRVAEKTAAAQNSGKLDSFVQKAKDVAAGYGADVCDVYLYWKNLYNSGVDTTELLINRINHPSEEMHAVTAELLMNTLCDMTQ